jgi:hypothetical protein
VKTIPTEPEPPTVPRWLFDAAKQTGPTFGTAFGFAAAGYMAGWEDARRGRGSRPTGTGWPTSGGTA